MEPGLIIISTTTTTSTTTHETRSLLDYHTLLQDDSRTRKNALFWREDLLTPTLLSSPKAHHKRSETESERARESQDVLCACYSCPHLLTHSTGMLRCVSFRLLYTHSLLPAITLLEYTTLPLLLLLVHYSAFNHQKLNDALSCFFIPGFPSCTRAHTRSYLNNAFTVIIHIYMYIIHTARTYPVLKRYTQLLITLQYLIGRNTDHTHTHTHAHTLVLLCCCFPTLSPHFVVKLDQLCSTTLHCTAL